MFGEHRYRTSVLADGGDGTGPLPETSRPLQLHLEVDEFGEVDVLDADVRIPAFNVTPQVEVVFIFLEIALLLALACQGRRVLLPPRSIADVV